MKKVLAVAWAAVPPLVFSALIHAVDPDVGGIGGLARPSAILSVVVYGVPLVAMTMFCLWVAVRSRAFWWIVPGVVFSAAIALALTVLQTPSPRGLAGYGLHLAGGTVVVFLFLAVAVVPAWALHRQWAR